MSPRFLALAVALFALLAGASQAQTAAVMYPSGNISATGYVQAGGVSATNGYFTGSVGLGTNSPSYPLDVSGTVRATAFIGNGAGLTGISSGVSVTTGASGSLVYRDAYGSLVASSGLSISSTTGSVGIGAGAPASVVNGLYAAGNIQSGGNMTANSVYAAGLYPSSVISFQTAGQADILWNAGTNAALRGDGTNRYLAFLTNSTEAMRIVSTGYVGIGTSAPKANLHISAVNGRIALQNTNDSSTAGGLWQIRTGHYGISFEPNTSSNNDFSTVGFAGFATQVSNGSVAMIVGGPANVNTDISLINRGLYVYGRTGISTNLPSTTLHVSGTIRMADGGEACDANRLGAIKYASGAFYICQNTTNGWEPLATTGASANTDRITSNSMAGVTANSTGYISLTTGGVTGTAYFTPASVLVNVGVSSTGAISGTYGYFSGSTSTQSSTITLATGGKLGIVGNGGYIVRLGSQDSASMYIEGGFNGGGLGFRNANSSSSNASLYSPANNILGINTSSTTNLMVFNNNKISVGFGTTQIPSTTLEISGTLKIANSGEACDANRLGAIKYASNEFYLCRNGTSWENLTSIGAGAATDRITSSSQAGLTANSTGTISLTTGGVTGTAYFDTSGRLVNAGVSTTGPVSATAGYYSGNVGIGTTTPAYPLDISGTAQATQFLNTSDRRLKQDIKPLSAGLEDLRKLRPVTFRWKARPSDGEKLGLIAQEVEQVIPQAVKTAADPSGTKAIDYNALVPLLIKAIQQQQEEIDTLKAQLKAANDNDARLAREIEAIKATVNGKR